MEILHQGVDNLISGGKLKNNKQPHGCSPKREYVTCRDRDRKIPSAFPREYACLVRGRQKRNLTITLEQSAQRPVQVSRTGTSPLPWRAHCWMRQSGRGGRPFGNKSGTTEQHASSLWKNPKETMTCFFISFFADYIPSLSHKTLRRESS